MAQTSSHTPPQTTSLAALRRPDTLSAPAEMRAGFDTVGGFELMQRGAKLLASSTIVPSSYRSQIEKKVGGGVQMVENPSAMSNCVVALNMAQRMGADPLMIMQNLYIVEGRPAWSSQYIIASINACGKYSPLRFSIEDLGEREAEYTHIKWEGKYPDRRRTETQVKTTILDKRCIAWAIEKATGERLESPPVTVELAVKEGWYGKEGSKWQTMPEVMLRYRAASFFGKLYAPELLMGIQTAEEVRDGTYSFEPDESGTYQMTTEEIRRNEPAGKEPEAAASAPAPATDAEPAKPAQAAPADSARASRSRAATRQPAAPRESAAPAKQESAPAQATSGRERAVPGADAGGHGGSIPPSGLEQRAEPQGPALSHNPHTGEVFGTSAIAAGGQASLAPASGRAARGGLVPQDEEFPSTMILCPNSDKMVDEFDCIGKSCHNGCPQFM